MCTVNIRGHEANFYEAEIEAEARKSEAEAEAEWFGSGFSWSIIMQTICTSLQTDNYTNTSSLNFYSLDSLPDAQPTVSSTEGINNSLLLSCHRIRYKSI